MLVDTRHIVLLVLAARLDQYLGRTQQDLIVAGALLLVERLAARLLQEQVHRVRREIAGLGLAIEVFQYVGSSLDPVTGAGQLKHVATIAQGHAETRLDQFEMFVALTAEVGETLWIIGLEAQCDDAVGL